MIEARPAAGRTPRAFARELTRLAVLALALAASSPGLAQEPEDEPVTITGRFLLPDGEPAVGASVVVRGWVANQDRLMKFGSPKNYKDPDPVEIGEDGTFEVSFVPPRAYQFVVDVNLEGYVEAGWRWGELEQGSKRDLGETTLEPAGAIEGSILDPEGNSLIGTWRVTAEVKRRWGADGRQAPRAYASPDRETGIFRLDGLPAGEVIVKARDRGHARIAEQKFEVVAGKVTRIALEYEGPSLANKINVTVFTRPFYIFEPDEKSIRLKLPTGDVKEAHHVEGSSQTYRFDDVDPGEYEVEIVDRRFKPWRQSGVENGANIDAMLEGNAGVRLSVVDPDGEPVREYGLRIEFHRSGWSPREFELAKAGTTHESVAYFGGLLPTPFKLIARVEGWPDLEVAVEDLQPNETREVTATLKRGSDLAGRVVDADGQPFEGATVEYTKGEKAGHNLGPGGSMTTAEGRIPPKKGDVTTDADGRFRIEGLVPGTWTLRARISEWIVVDQAFELGSGGTDDAVLTSPGAGWLEGRVEIPEGGSLEELDLALRVHSMPISMGFGRGGEESQIEPDGSFRLGPLPVGEVGVQLVFMVFDEDRSGWRGNHIDQGDFTIVAGETTEVIVDLRETYPGRMRVVVRVDGEPAEGVIVYANEPPGEPARSRASNDYSDREGRTVVTGMTAGEWRVTLRPRDRSWLWQAPELVRVPVAGEVEVELDVRLAERRVRFLDDATGEPLAKRTILAQMGEGWRASKQEIETDGEGYATFVLCGGTVRFGDAGSEDAKTTEVEWRVEGEGPGDVRLEIGPD